MTFYHTSITRILPLAILMFAALPIFGQAGAAGSLTGMVNDPTGAVIPNATVTLKNQMSGFTRTVTTDATGQFTFTNIPFNPYQLYVRAEGFAPLSKPVDVDSAVEVNVKAILHIAGASSTVTVESTGPMVENTSTFHTDISRDLFIKVPLESQSSSLSSLVTLTTPGVAADSNGLFHGLGDHASNSFAIDGQPITDQQSKVFSNQLPSNAVQSLEVIEGAPPAQYGDKTSLIIVATTRSGQGITKPTGDVYASYGSFGSSTGGFDLSYGGKGWGNFVEADGLDTGRFLDPPEFAVFHDKGNELNLFDRVDYTFTPANSIHLDLNYTRSWFQTPNAYGSLSIQNVVSDGASTNPLFANVGDTDQRSKINTFNIAPTFTHVISNKAVFNLGLYARRDDYDYFPSPNPLADFTGANLQTSSVSQYRTLTNIGAHADLTYVHGRQNILAGAQYEQTFLREHDSLGIVDSTYNAPCLDANGNPLPGYFHPIDCPGGATGENPAYLPVLAPYDLTRGGAYYLFFGHTDVKETALYIEDKVTAGNWKFNLGIRGDLYNGLAVQTQAEPRVGIAYQIPQTKTVLGISYARTLETPFNENLVLSSVGCSDPVLSPLLACTSGVEGILQPGWRNGFYTSLQQAFGKYLVFTGEYIWKYTHNSFDFSVLGNTPITFPIDWHNSKIPGYAFHIQVPNYRGLSVYTDMSSVAARFFPPQVAGAGATVGQSGYAFRIDHDEKFNQITHLQYTIPGKKLWGGMWGGFNWRYDSGLVAGSVPCYNVTDPNSLCNPANGGPSITLPNGRPGVDLSGLTPDEQFEAGITCDGVKATPTFGFDSCPASEYTSTLVSIPAPGTENDDHNPPRIAPRNLFDVSVGMNNILHTDRYKMNLDLTAINVTNKYALYNFLSTFSGTHYVTPRALTAKVTLSF